MKVIQINTTANKGSTGRIAEQIGIAIHQAGGDSIIAYGRDFNPSKNKLFRIGNDIDVIRHGFNSVLLGKHGESSFYATKKLIAFIKKENPDIIHLHNIHGYYLHYPLFFNFLIESKIKVVWTLHDCWSFTGHCSYFSDIGCEKWKNKCFQCPKQIFYPRSFFFDTSSYYFELKKELFNRLSIEIVTVSKWLKKITEQSILKNHSIRSIWNGVDEHIFKIDNKNQKLVEKHGLAGKTVLLAASTSWSKQKGLEDYKRLAKHLKNEIIVLVGLPVYQRIQLPTNIIGVDRTESLEELASWYATADIVLNLSNQETFGLTNVEAFMSGKPVIAYNTTASPEIVSAKHLGRTIEYANIQGVYEAIQELKESKIDAQLIRNHGIENFSLKKQIDAYIHLYQSLLQDKIEGK